MRIISIELHKFKRLLLNNITTLTYKPDSDIQLILGTNGCGKSSLLYELSPLPAASSDYGKDGYKLIELEDRGSTFVLTSTFKSGNKHSFVKDGEEMNPGGTGAVQTELVWQEFGINKEIHELLTGRTVFTNLSPSKRREWVTKLSDVDFTYALGVFKKLKTATRDAQGALKHVKSRLVSENNKLLALGEIEELETRYKELHEQINFIFENRDPNAEPLLALDEKHTSLNNELELVAFNLVKSLPTMPSGHHFRDTEAVETEFQRLKTDREVQVNLKSRIASELSDLQEMVSEYSAEGVESIDQVKEKLAKVEATIVELSKTLSKWKGFDGDARTAKRSLYEIKDGLSDILVNLPINEDKRYNRDALKTKREELPKIVSEKDRLKNKLSSAERQLEHLLSLKEQQCPECNHRWVPGRSDAEKESLEKGIVVLRERIKEEEDKEASVREYIHEAEDYASAFVNLRQLVNQSIALKEFWDELLKSDALYSAPKSIVPSIYVLESDLNTLIELEELKKTKEHLTSLLEGDSDGKQFNKVKERMVDLENQIQEIILNIEKTDRQLSLIGTYKSNLDKYLHQVSEMNRLIDELSVLKDAYIKSLREDELTRVLKAQQSELAVLQSKRNEKIALEGVIKDLELSEAELDLDHTLLSDLADELSPIDGLIAEQLKGFIQTFVTHVNQVIESVWNYELKVLPCGTESGDLDYKFPLFVRHEGKENNPPDISKGSEAQIDVVNFAFRLVIMSYLKLDPYPVYLDEVGSSFDEQHRLNIMRFIKSLLDTNSYSQLFMINHYAAQFGAFPQADINILDSSNISVPQEYNQHLKIA